MAFNYPAGITRAQIKSKRVGNLPKPVPCLSRYLSQLSTRSRAKNGTVGRILTGAACGLQFRIAGDRIPRHAIGSENLRLHLRLILEYRLSQAESTIAHRKS